MRRQEIEERLNDYIDGLLDEVEAREVEAWLAEHPEDRAVVDKTRSLQAAAGELPRSVEPGRDLWPGIHAGIEAGGTASAGADEAAIALPPTDADPIAFRPRRAALNPWWGALAASLVVVLGGALVALQLLSGGDDAPVIADGGRTVNGAAPSVPAPAVGTPAVMPATQTTPAGALDVELLAAEAEFLRATEQLMTVLEARRDQLPPEKLRFVESNLQAINVAIDEIRDALQADPGNSSHEQALAAMYKKKMQLLWMASRLSEET